MNSYEISKFLNPLGSNQFQKGLTFFAIKSVFVDIFFEIKSLLNQLGLVVSLAIMASFGINGLSRKIIFYLGGQLGFRIL